MGFRVINASVPDCSCPVNNGYTAEIPVNVQLRDQYVICSSRRSCIGCDYMGNKYKVIYSLKIRFTWTLVFQLMIGETNPGDNKKSLTMY